MYSRIFCVPMKRRGHWRGYIFAAIVLLMLAGLQT